MNDDEVERRGNMPSPAERITRLRKSRARVSSGPITWSPFRGSPVKGTVTPDSTCERSLTKVAGSTGRSSSESLFTAR